MSKFQSSDRGAAAAAASGGAARGSKAEIEAGTDFQPRFDEQGLIPAIVSDGETREVLMFAYMNAEALRLSLATGAAHFWTRSRQRIWKKGEESGNVLQIMDIRVDCDQDVLWLKVKAGGGGVACHTGRRSCFYRRLSASFDENEMRTKLTFIGE